MFKTMKWCMCYRDAHARVLVVWLLHRGFAAMFAGGTHIPPLPYILSLDVPDTADRYDTSQNIPGTRYLVPYST